jgi:hypothetical protein
MSARTRNIVEATGVVSIVAGLLLVAYQINQATSIASAQARAEYSAGWRSVDSTRQSENFAEVLAKSIYYPNELTPAEILELDAYYIGILDQIQSAKANWEGGIRSSHWEVAVDFVAQYRFGNEFSRSWWNLAKERYARSDGEQFVATIDAAIEASDSDGQKRLINALQKTTD